MAFQYLSERLTAVSAMVSRGYRLCDVGTDHGHLPIRLCQEEKIPSAIAMDIHAGPLERARENIRKAGLEGRIRLRLSDGLKALKADEADCVVISGMGGKLISGILQQRPDLFRGPAQIRELVLGPQSEAYKVRQQLYSLSFSIIDEDMIFEDGKFYPMIKAVPFSEKSMDKQPGKMKMADSPELYFGPCLIRKKHPVLVLYLHKKMEENKKLLLELGENAFRSERSAERMEDIFAENERIKHTLQLMKA